MANTKQSIKRARQNDARYKLKHAQRARARTAVKAVRNAIIQNDKELASSLLKEAEKVLDATKVYDKCVTKCLTCICTTMLDATQVCCVRGLDWRVAESTV